MKHIREQGYPSPLIITRDTKYKNLFFDGTEMARQIINAQRMPDGVFAACDLLAIALLQEVLRAGIRVPQDMAIMGCDNTEICLYTSPTLSSIDFNIPLLAGKMMEQMIRIIKNDVLEPVHVTMPVKLIVRESTKK